MTGLELVRQQADHLLNRTLRVFDRAVRSIPAGHFGLRPTPHSMTAREMAHHVYQILVISAVGIERGECTRAGVEAHCPPVEAIRDEASLAELAAVARAVAERALSGLSEEALGREISFYFGMRATGMEVLRNLTEEVLHHRGQMQIYLRLMGIEPPSLRDFS